MKMSSILNKQLTVAAKKMVFISNLKDNEMIKKLLVAVAATTLLLTGCSNDGDVASKNLSKDAANFQIPSRVLFYNGITNDYILLVEGICTTDLSSDRTYVDVICKDGDGYKKISLYLSDNVTYFSEQLDFKNVSTTHYKVVFKPSVITTDIEMR